MLTLTTLAACSYSVEPTSVQRELMSDAFQAERDGDFVEAVTEYRRFAQKGIPEAQYRLGRLYSGRVESLTNGPEAVKWLEEAAKNDHEAASILAARLYDSGDIVEQDNAKAAFYYRRVLDQGDPSVAYRLAEMIAQGRAGEVNMTRAVGLLSQSARQEYGPSYKRLAEIYQDGEGSVRSNDALAERYWERYANFLAQEAGTGDAKSNQELGLLYINGVGVAQDVPLGLGYLTRAAETGRTSAQRELGKVYLKGVEGAASPQPAKGVEWLKRAADSGDTSAMRTLGDAYRKGEGVAENHQLAKRFYERAVAAGDERAIARLGDLLRRPKSPVYDPSAAFNYNSRAATAGNEKAMFFVGEAYDKGNGVAKDLELALFWYRTSERNGYNRAGKSAEKLSSQLTSAQLQRVDAELSRL